MALATELGLSARHPSAPARLVQRIASSAAGARLLARALPRLDALTLRITGGRTTCTEKVAALPTIYLTTRGARTGRARTTPLLAVMTGSEVAVIGSNWGRTQQPGWVYNLLADPHGTVSCHGRSVDVIAREATGAAADRIWSAGRALYRGYRTYPARTHGREIRVFVLEDAMPGE